METVFLNYDLKNKGEVLAEVRKILASLGVNQEYLDSFKEREQAASFSIGNYIAIPHGTYEASKKIRDSKYVVLHLKNPVEWDGDQVQIIVGLAINNDEQLEVLQNIVVNSMNDEFFNDLLANPDDQKLKNLMMDEEQWM